MGRACGCRVSTSSDVGCYALRGAGGRHGQGSSREPADNDLQVVSFLDPALVHGQRVDLIAGNIGTDVMIADPTATSFDLGCLPAPCMCRLLLLMV